jgi:LacI family transcriptional regulator
MIRKSSNRTTLFDVANLAGVGSATVDRVINERGNVSEDIRKRVLDAARTLGLKRILPLAHHRIVRLNVILARPELPLIQRMGFEFRRLAQRMQHSLAIHRTLLEDEDPVTIVAALHRGEYDAVIVYAQDHPLIRAAIADLAAQGRPVVTMISDLPGSERLAYAGTDHYKAGRSAGYFMGLMARSGPVVVLCNHLGFQSHAARLDGLKDQLAEASDLSVVEVVEGGDDPIRSEVRVKEAFRRHPDTVAIYNVGAGNRGVVAAIKADILPRRPIFIGHELTPFTHASLREGSMTLTIDQSPELQAQFALEVLLSHFGFEGVTDLAPPYASTVPIVLYGPQNLPDTLPV